MAYNKDTNYQEEINKAVARGDYASASRLEKERNEKIDGEGLSQYTKTSNFVKPEGITDATYNAMNKQYTASERQGELDANVSKAQTNYNNVAGSNPISNKTQSALDKGYKKSSAVKKADAWLAEQLEIIQSGKTSYSDQVRDMMDKIMNRDKFSYDVDEDPLFQQALASAMKSGQQAMTDTIGQASALTGGYGSTYATTAGNQAYNAYVEDAYDNLPQYYQMAREAYDKEGEEMYRQFGMVSELDDKEYNRNLAAYDATYQHRNALYNEEYGRYRDEKSDAFNMAGLEVDLYGHKVNNALNAYNMAKDMADTERQFTYNSWLDAVNIAMQQGQIERGAYEYDKSFDESVRQADRAYEQTEKWNQAEMDYKNNALRQEMNYKYAALAQDKELSYAKIAADAKKVEDGGDGVDEGKLYVASKSKNVSNFKASVMTKDEFKRRRGKAKNFEGDETTYDTYDDYVEGMLEKWYEKDKLQDYEVQWLLIYYNNPEEATKLTKNWNEG